MQLTWTICLLKSDTCYFDIDFLFLILSCCSYFRFAPKIITTINIMAIYQIKVSFHCVSFSFTQSSIFMMRYFTENIFVVKLIRKVKSIWKVSYILLEPHWTTYRVLWIFLEPHYTTETHTFLWFNVFKTPIFRITCIFLEQQYVVNHYWYFFFS